MGIHGQQWVHNTEELAQLIQDSNGISSVFVSHNSYPDENHPAEHDGRCPPISNVRYVRVAQQYIDLDAKKLENALADARKLVEWCDEHKLPWFCAFSGRKGFQFTILFEPAVYDITEEVQIDADTHVQWRSYYSASHAWIKHTLDLRTLDLAVAEPKRIMRVWNTMHFRRGSDEPTGTHCVPLTRDQIMKWYPSQILGFAETPADMLHFTQASASWNHNKEYIRFDQFLDKFEISPTILSPTGIASDAMVVGYKKGDGKNWELFKSLMPDMCVHNEMYNSNNPRHIARFASAVYWKQMSDDPRSAIQISEEWVDKFYREMQYDDVENQPERHRQIRSVFNRGPNSTRSWLPLYKYPSCRKLFASGICVGPTCPKFDIFLKGYREHVEFDEANKNWKIKAVPKEV